MKDEINNTEIQVNADNEASPNKSIVKKGQGEKCVSILWTPNRPCEHISRHFLNCQLSNENEPRCREDCRTLEE